MNLERNPAPEVVFNERQGHEPGKDSRNVAVCCSMGRWAAFATTTRCGGMREESSGYLLYLFWIGHFSSTGIKTLCDGHLKRSSKRAMIRDLEDCMGGGDSSFRRILFR